MQRVVVSAIFFLEPISDMAPAGVDYSPLLEFEQVSTLSKWLAERAIQAEREREALVDPDTKQYEEEGKRQLATLGGIVKGILGKEPSTDSVRKALTTRSTDLLQTRGKDLRVVTCLARAWVSESGMSGLADAFDLADALLTRFETCLHPLPDEDEDSSDYSGRAIVLSELFNGQELVAVLRETVLLPSTKAGRLVVRDIEVIDQILFADHSDGARSVKQIAIIATAANDGDVAAARDMLSEHISAIGRCLEGAARVAGHFPVGKIHGDRVQALLKRVKARLAEAIDGEQATAPAGVPGTRNSTVGADVLPRGFSGAVGVILNRAEARRLIVVISDFIERTEPSHPAPLLLRRAAKLLDAKDFFEIVREMTPDGMRQLEVIAGRPDKPADDGSN